MISDETSYKNFLIEKITKTHQTLEDLQTGKAVVIPVDDDHARKMLQMATAYLGERL